MRIVAGTAGGRHIAGPKGRATRPMTDRAKEGLFSSIAADLPDARVLDLYAGSGALGLEALSRGAAAVTFVERDRRALAALRSNVATIDLGGTVVDGDVLGFLQSTSGSFDLAFVDPPYDLSLPSVEEVLQALEMHLQPGALVVVHRRVGEPRPAAGQLAPSGDRQYGTAQIWRYRAIDERNEDPA